MSSDWFRGWVQPADESETEARAAARIYTEIAGARPESIRAIRERVVDHFVGIQTVLTAGGLEEAADIIANSLPTQKRVRSGDLGELLAVEFLHAETDFRVPILKLRWKSDRDTPLHGNDVIAVDTARRRVRVLKGECKSRAKFQKSHATEAVSDLDGDGCRPRPATLAFIVKRLLEEDRDEEAAVFRMMKPKGLRLQDIEHLLFVLSGNNPKSALAKMPPPARKTLRQRWAAAIIVKQHQEFVEEVYRGWDGT